MPREIKSLAELGEIPCSSVVYFTRNILDLNEEFYAVGLVIEGNAPKGIKYVMEVKFLQAVRAVYFSPVMKGIREFKRFYEYNWDTEPLSVDILKKEVPKGKNLIHTRAPVPKTKL